MDDVTLDFFAWERAQRTFIEQYAHLIDDEGMVKVL